jgi:Ca-activated chloride channel family protein
MTFHSPHILWLLVPLVLLFSWELARHSARAAAVHWPKIVRAWAGARAVSLGARHSTIETRPRLWLWFGLAACIVALARPQWGVVEEPVFDQAREVLLAVDLSKSMLSPDVKPSRLERTKLLIQTLLDRLKGERVGLVVFSGTAFLQSPLSADYEILREFLPSLNPAYLPEGGTDYRALLETCIQAFGTSAADRYLIILSDGEATDEEWRKLTDRLREKGIRVIALGVGTAPGSFIPDGAGGFVKDERGAVVMSRLNSATLQELAQVTGGVYTDASSWVDLSALLQRTIATGRKGEFREKNAARRIERFQWFLAPGLALLLLSFWIEFPVRPRERALPLGAIRDQRTDVRGQKSVPIAATLVLLFSVLFHLTSVSATEGAESYAAPLAKTVNRLAAKDALSARDCADLARTTLTYGERMKSSQQPPVEGAVRDALAAVDLGEKLDRTAADWPKLRRDLEALLQKPEEQKQPQQQDQKQNPQDQQKQQQQNQDQQSQSQDQKQQQEQSQPQDQKQQEQQQQQPQNQQSAFGDMNKEQPPTPEPEKKEPPPSGTQKVGGQPDKPKSDEEKNPELAMPLQKLDQVRNQDSPAKLFQLLENRRPEKPKTGKDW